LAKSQNILVEKDKQPAQEAAQAQNTTPKPLQNLSAKPPVDDGDNGGF
jgi:hypothetical protein